MNFLEQKIAVVCGGVSTEREVSINSGTNVYNSLKANGIDTILIEINQDNLWELNNLKSQGVNLVFNALHGKFGEDGQVQALLDITGINYTGSGVMASSMAMNKEFAYKILDQFGIRVPKTFSFKKGVSLEEIKLQISSLDNGLDYPFIVKPNDGGSSIGVTLVNSEEELQSALDSAFADSETVLIQEFVKGREVTCPVIGNKKQALIALPTGEIQTKNTFFDYQAKYTSSETLEIFPAEVPPLINQKIQLLAKQIHELLNCEGLTRSDFIYTENASELVFLEINTSPGMTKASLCPKSAEVFGWDFFELIKQICESALENN